MVAQLKTETKNWQLLNNTLFVPHSDSDYKYLVKLMDSLIDEVEENESHPLANLMEIIGVLIENYENEIHQKFNYYLFRLFVIKLNKKLAPSYSKMG